MAQVDIRLIIEAYNRAEIEARDAGRGLWRTADHASIADVIDSKSLDERYYRHRCKNHYVLDSCDNGGFGLAWFPSSEITSDYRWKIRRIVCANLLNWRMFIKRDKQHRQCRVESGRHH